MLQVTFGTPATAANPIAPRVLPSLRALRLIIIPQTTVVEANLKSPILNQ